MEKICKSKDRWGQVVVYVEECRNYEHEDQSDPFDIHNIENYRIYDIIVNRIEGYN